MVDSDSGTSARTGDTIINIKASDATSADVTIRMREPVATSIALESEIDSKEVRRKRGQKFKDNEFLNRKMSKGKRCRR